MSQAVVRSVLGIAKPLASTYDVALLDLDGVVYLGPQPIAGGAVGLANARALGMRLAFVTNNASRDPATVAKHLTELGVPAEAADVVTSSQAAATVVVEHLGVGSTVLVIGTAALRTTVEIAGLRPVASADDHPDAVVQGYSPDLTYADLAECAIAVRAGAYWVATNTDSTLPSPRGLLPGNGSLVAAVATATGKKPVVAGKPELPLHAEGVRRSGAVHPLVVGDRLDTDIEGAYAAHTDSLLVLTGVARPIDLVNAPIKHRPTYVALDLAGLVEEQPDVDFDGEIASCGGWTARASSGDATIRVVLDGGGAPLAGLRATLIAGWSARDAGVATTKPAVDATAALQQLSLG